MKLSLTQQKFQHCLEEFVAKDDYAFMFIRPPKRYFNLSYCLVSFMVNFGEGGEFSQILYLADTKWQSVSMYEDFCNSTKGDERFVHSGDNKSVSGNMTYVFDYIHSPRLRGLNEKTFFIFNIQIYKEHSFLESIRQCQLKSVWIIRDDSEWMLVSKKQKACFFAIERVFLFDDNFEVVEEECELKWT